MTPIEFMQKYVSKNGIIYISHKRHSPFTVYFIKNDIYTLNKFTLKNAIFTLISDAKNLEMFNSNN